MNIVVFRILFLCLFFPLTYSAQDNLSAYNSERENLYLQGQDITEKDKLFSSEHGEILPALVKKEITANLLLFTFSTHRTINSSNEQRVQDRLKQAVPSIVAISNTGNIINVSFNVSATEQELNAFFKLTGFDGYKIMNAE